MKTILKFILAIVLIALVVVGAISILKAAGISTPLDDMADSVTTTAANAVVDATGIKTKAQNALEANATEIAEATGLPVSTVNAIIDDMDIESWKATTLPADAIAIGEQDISYEGMAATVTTYNNPSIVTVESNGAKVTLEVPESAQGYLQYMQYMN